MKLIQGENLVLLKDAQQIPLPPHFPGAEITGVWHEPDEKTVTVELAGRYVMQLGAMDGERPAPGQPYRMGIRFGEIIMAGAPYTEGHSLMAAIGGRKLLRIRVDRSAGLIVDMDAGYLMQINKYGIVVAAEEDAPPAVTH